MLEGSVQTEINELKRQEQSLLEMLLEIRRTRLSLQLRLQTESIQDVGLEGNSPGSLVHVLPPSTSTLANKPGKSKQWMEMTQSELAAAAALGYDEASWEAGAVTEACGRQWAALSENERRAATLLGYEAAEWEEEAAASVEVGAAAAAVQPPSIHPQPPQQLPGLQPPGPPQLESVLGKDKGWAEMIKVEHEAAVAIGYNQALWDAGAVTETCGKQWAALSAQERNGAMLLGYNADEWDAEITATLAATSNGHSNSLVPQGGELHSSPGKDKGWAEMETIEHNAAALLGYDEALWEAGAETEACGKEWAALSAREREGALVLGYDAAGWDAEAKSKVIV